jgi:hypothetical protein|tara:strand:- start:1031 stop:1627 length:597 start_codon:yes stop_codon:yes gene_type:complete
MKIAIHQPEHFPYMGFFQKMQSVDVFVVLDDVQYTKGGWQNRNKFLNKNDVDEFFTVQVEKGANKKLIKDVGLVDGPWRKKIIKKIQQNFGFDLSYIYNKDSLLEMNMLSIEWGRDKLGINTEMIMSSDLGIKSTKTERILDICKELNADEYVCGQGCLDQRYGAYLDTAMFSDIELTVHKPSLKNYYSVIYNVSETK